jgi:hypothetical protein
VQSTNANWRQLGSFVRNISKSVRGSISMRNRGDAERNVTTSNKVPAIGMTFPQRVIPRQRDVYEMHTLCAEPPRLLTQTMHCTFTEMLIDRILRIKHFKIKFAVLFIMCCHGDAERNMTASNKVPAIGMTFRWRRHSAPARQL